MAWQAIAAALGGQLIGGAFSAKAQQQANDLNADMARENRNWMQAMTETAHQTEMNDLKAAGLNPILSAGGSGASSGSAQMMEQKAVNPMSGIGDAISSAFEERRVKKEEEMLDEQKKMNQENTNLLRDQAHKTVIEANLADQNKLNAQQLNEKERIARPAFEAEVRARKQLAELETIKAKEEKKFVNFDNYEKRVNRVINGVSNAVDIINPAPKLIKGIQNASQRPPHSAKSQRSHRDTTGIPDSHLSEREQRQRHGQPQSWDYPPE